MTRLIVALAIAAPHLCSAQHDAFTKRLEAEFGSTGQPGLVVAVFQDGQTVYQHAFGKADVEKGTAMRADMQFEVGSVSKQFTAVCVLMLVDEGKLRLDEKLGEALPTAPSTWHHVTVEQLLRHVSGVPDYEEIATYDFYNQPRKPQDIFAQALKKDLDFAAGDKYSYSNTGYVLLSLIVERASGTSIGKFLESRIFKKLGMDDTFAETVPGNEHMATGYHSRTGERKAQPRIAWSSTLGAGGIVSTVADLQKWDEALYTDKVIKKESLDKVWTKGRLNDGSVSSYGFGWITDVFRGFNRQQHSGQTNGFTCYFMRYPERHTSILVWTNTYGGSVGLPATIASAHFVPGMSYLSTAIPQDPDPERTKTHLKALRQAVLAEGELDLISDGLKAFAKADEYKALRAEVDELVRTGTKFEFLSLTNRSNGAQAIIYRLNSGRGVKFFTLTVRDGKLVGINWEDE